MRTKRVLSLALLVFIFLFSFLFFLSLKKNILSRQMACKRSCIAIDKKYSSSVSDFQADYNLLLRYRAKNLSGQKITEAEMEMLTERLIKEVSTDELGVCHGVACIPYAYVRKYMDSNQAKNFVKRHELTHLLNNRADLWGEIEANFKAALKYPFGAFEVISDQFSAN